MLELKAVPRMRLARGINRKVPFTIKSNTPRVSFRWKVDAKLDLLSHNRLNYVIQI